MFNALSVYSAYYTMDVSFCSINTKSSFPHVLMVTKTASSLPFSFFPRFGFAPGHRTESSSLSPHAEKPDEDWYIPYNGPFEPPRNGSDSSYHVSQDDVKAILEDSRLLDRYGDVSVDATGTVGLGAPPAELTRFPGNRLRSDLIRRATSSSSAIDPTLPHRQSQASVPRLQVLTHVSTDASGDVGGSPMPMQRTAVSTPQKRTSRFFGFGTSKKPKGRSTSTPVSPVARTTIPGVWLPSSTQHNTIQDNDRFAKHIGSSSSTDDHFDAYYSIPPPSHSSHTHHYQPSIDCSPSKRHPLRHLDQRGTSDQNSSLSSPSRNYNSAAIHPHPYANTSSSVSLQISRPTTSGSFFQTATSQQSHQGYRRQDSGSYSHYSRNPTHRSRTLTYAIDPRMHRAVDTRPLPQQLKSSVSTPNLSEAALDKRPPQLRTKSPPPTSGFDRWLSAETWCDALFFPRPRLKVKGLHERHGGSSGRIVSPPVTPISEGAPSRLSPALLGGRPRVMSTTCDAPRARVLSKSRSNDVLSGPSIFGRPRTAPSPQRYRDPDAIPEISLKDATPAPGTSTVPRQELRPSSPVPSLTQ